MPVRPSLPRPSKKRRSSLSRRGTTRQLSARRSGRFSMHSFHADFYSVGSAPAACSLRPANRLRSSSTHSVKPVTHKSVAKKNIATMSTGESGPMTDAAAMAGIHRSTATIVAGPHWLPWMFPQPSPNKQMAIVATKPNFAARRSVGFIRTSCRLSTSIFNGKLDARFDKLPRMVWRSARQ
jgi:hypothetical protein